MFLGDEGQPQSATVARHIAYVAELVGIEHVGIGLDFDPWVYDLNDPNLLDEDNPESGPPDAGYDQPIHSLSVTKLPEVCDELLAIGFTQTDLAAIRGGNFRRVVEQVWK